MSVDLRFNGPWYCLPSKSLPFCITSLEDAIDGRLEFGRRREKSFCSRGVSDARLANRCVHFCFLLPWLNIDAGLDLILYEKNGNV